MNINPQEAIMSHQFHREPAKGEVKGTHVTRNMGRADMQQLIDERIAKLAEAEKITKVELRELSRLVVEYITLEGVDDIARVNRLVEAVTPFNRRGLVPYCKHFLPFKSEQDENGKHIKFTTKIKSDKTLKAKYEEAKEFLSDPSNDFWSWSEKNLDVDKKAFNLSSYVTDAVTLAMNGKKETRSTEAADPLTPVEIIEAVLAAGIGVDDVINAVAVAESNKGAVKKELDKSEAEAKAVSNYETAVVV